MLERTTYHHGDLRRALIDTAATLIAERGVAGVSLRELARRAQVSHTAPAHHFSDKLGLFTAIAAEGFQMLAVSLSEERNRSQENDVAVDAPSVLREMGVRYVRFALTHPAHFDVMFQPDLHHADDPDLRTARAEAARLLQSAVPGGSEGQQAPEYVVAAWSAAHGFATLWRSGGLTRTLGQDDPEDSFRRAAETMFSGLDPFSSRDGWDQVRTS